MNQHLIWRPLRHTDIPALTRLLAEAEEADATSEHYDAVDLSEEFADGGLELETDSIAVLDGPTLIGMGLLRGRNLDGDVHVVELWGAVHPHRRGEGVGRGILAHQLHRGAALHAEAHPRRAGRLVVRPYDHCTEHVRLVRAAGLVPVRRWFDMQRELSEPLPAVPVLSAGLRIVPYDSGRDDDVRIAYNLAFAENFGAVEQDRDGWRQWFTGSRAFLPELSTMVLSGTDLVGFLLSYFYEADAAADGYREGWIGQVGTLPELRGRGIGTALITGALHAHAEAGFSKAALDVDGVSAADRTGIDSLSIYSRLGFRVARKRTSFVRELPVHG